MMFDLPEDDEPQEADVYALMARDIDPSQGVLYDYIVQLLKEAVGVNAEDGTEDFTYYGLPAEAPSPTLFEGYD